MKHAEIIALPIGTQVVVSERASTIERANTNNSVIAVLASHDNYEKPYWSGMYWRPITDVFAKTDSSNRTKRYRITTTRIVKDSNGNDVTETLHTLVQGKEILGAYTADIQNIWDAREIEAQKEQEERDRQREIEKEVEVLGRAQVTAKEETIRKSIASILRRNLTDMDGVTVYIRQGDVKWLDVERTRAVPTLTGQVQFSLSALEEFIERIYEDLDAR